MTMKEVDQGDVFVRCHGPFDKGFVYRGHRHWIDHDSYVHEGTILSVKYRHHKDGEIIKESVYKGPCRFVVFAGLFHEIEILSEEGYWDCEFKKPEMGSPVHGVYSQELIE